MQQIAQWLDELGLSEHTERFVENKIDVAVLPLLTDEDLKEIGIPLGHRRKILAAINQGTRATQLAPVAGPAPSTELKGWDAPERRYMTVLFSDLVGSTALSARMDPEDLREVISAYQTCVAEAVGRFGGFVAKYMGDGALCTSATRKPMRTIPSAPCERRWNWSQRLLGRRPTRCCKRELVSRADK